MSRQMSEKVVDRLRDAWSTAEGKAKTHRRNAGDHQVAVRRELQNASEFDQEAAELRALLRVADPQNATLYQDAAESAEGDKTRAELIDGLRELADYLETHPQVPTPSVSSTNGVTVQLFPDPVRGRESEAAVDWVASLLGVTAQRPYPRAHYKAVRKFGPWIKLEVVSTAMSNLHWVQGDPLPPGLPPEVRAKYAPTPPTKIELPDPVVQCPATVQDERAIYFCIRKKGHDQVLNKGVDLTTLQHYNPEYGKWDSATDVDDADQTATQLAEPIGQTKAELARRKAAEAEATGDDFSPDIGEWEGVAEASEALGEGMVSTGAAGEVEA